jgi:hypothetical protein
MEERIRESSFTAQEGEEGQVPSDLFGNAEGLYANGVFG